MLPGYVVECFLAAGYDTLGVIGSMDVSHGPLNSLQQIEDHINSVHPSDPKFIRGTMPASTFKFPPGHRQTIEAFVKEVKQQEEEKKRLCRKRASEASCAITKKVPKAKGMHSVNSSGTGSSVDAPRSQSTTLGDIRRQIARWQ